MKRPGRVAVVGAGFGGSLLALIAARLGHEVLLVERATLPRFAIGESCTPMANLILADLSERYDLRPLRPLSRWGDWKRELPQVRCGLKRGFTYLAHDPGRAWVDTPDNAWSLLVAGSADDASGDTHWLRADVDLHFLQAAKAAGVQYRDNTEVRSLADLGAPDLVIDASGRAQALQRVLGTADQTARLRTATQATWAHFDGLPSWPDAPVAPYPAEQAAVHHLLDDAWVWSLRFDHGVVSLGLVSPAGAPPLGWSSQIARFPSLAEWIADGQEVSVRTGSGRLQPLVAPAAGPGWAMLPGAAGFIDPLHSAGIAHTLLGIERLAHLLEDGLPLGGEALVAYGDVVESELLHLDRLVAGCYARLAAGDTAGFFAFTKLYFVAAIVGEHRRRAGRRGGQGAFLLADDPDFAGRLATAERADAASIHDLLRPIDPIGVCDPLIPNRIPYG